MKLKHLFIAILTVFALVACHSSKEVGKSPDTGTAKVRAELYRQRVVEQMQNAPALTAKMKVSLDALGKDLSLNGSLRMKRNEVVQLSLSMLGFELGKMEFTPEDVLILDRINKQYVRCRYDEVAFLKAAELDFYALQSLFWDELFIPGKKELDAASLQRFSVSESGAVTLLSLKDTPRLTYDFRTQTSSANITGISVRDASASTPLELAFTYADFVDFSGKSFPTQVTAELKGAGKPMKIAFSLSRLGASSDWESRTAISSKYKQLGSSDLVSLGKKLLGK